MTDLRVWAPDGVGEVRHGDDLVALVVRAVPDLGDGDVVVIASKIVSKAEGRVVDGDDRVAAIADETVREVARRGDSVIAQTRHGFVMAAAGVDASNVEPGRLVLLPRDPDQSARDLRAGIRASTGARVGVVVTDTFGRPWRHGQTDLAIGAAGISVLSELAGELDRYGNRLVVTAAAVADELAGAADLVKHKLSARPIAVVRGMAHALTDDDGPGVAALIRLGPLDMFRLGNREAVAEAYSASVDTLDPLAATTDGAGLDLATLADVLEATGLADRVDVATDGTALVGVRAEVIALDPLEVGRAIGRAAVLLAGNGLLLTGRPPQLTVRHLTS